MIKSNSLKTKMLVAVCVTVMVLSVALLADMYASKVSSAALDGYSFSDMFTPNEKAVLTQRVTSPSYHAVPKTGLQIKGTGNGASIAYKGLINLSDNDISEPLFEVIFTPEKRGSTDFGRLYFTFTDATDPDNFLTVVLFGSNVNYPDQISVSAYGSNQAYYNMSWRSYSSSSYGMNDNPFAFYFDYQSMSAYGFPSQWGSQTDRNNQQLIRDLDDIDNTDGIGWLVEDDPAWTGFSAGLCYLTISMENLLSAEATMLLLNLDGIDFSKESPSAEDERMDIAVDYDGYEVDDLPYGLAGKSYPVLNATAVSNLEGSRGSLFPLIVDSDGNSLPVKSGRFTPGSSGFYYMLYEAESPLGTVVKKRARIIVMDAYDTDLTFVFNENIADAANVGDTVFLYEGKSFGGFGRLSVVNHVLYNGEEVTVYNEGYEDFFIPDKAGTYKFISTLRDYLNTEVSFTKQISIADNSGIVINVPPIPKAAVKGQKFEIPSASAVNYSGGSAQKIPVETRINGQLFDGDYYTPATSGSFVLSYSAGGTVKSYNIEVRNVLTESGYIKNYFTVENASLSFDNKEMVVSSTSSESSFEFINKIHVEFITFAFKLVEDYDDFSQIDFYLTDAKNAGNKIKITLLREDLGGVVNFYLVTNGKDKTLVLNNLFARIFEITFNNVTGEISILNEKLTGTIEFPITLNSDMRKFDGFESDYAYLSVQVSGTQNSFKIKPTNISNQEITDDVRDIAAPRICFEVKTPSVYRLPAGGAFYAVSVFGYDVITIGVTVEMRIVYNNTIEIYNGDASSGYTFSIANLGTYRISYTVTDLNGNSPASSTTKTVNVVDTKPPVITLKSGYKTSVKTGQVLTFASVNVSSNASAASDIKVYTIVSNSKGWQKLVSESSYTFDVADNYTVRIVAVDIYGNTAAVEYRVEVK